MHYEWHYPLASLAPKFALIAEHALQTAKAIEEVMR